jgi:phosphoribosylformylglycinamidine synthase
VALAEMSFAGQLGVDVELSGAQAASGLESVELLFSESNSRFLVEVDAAREHELLALLAELPAVRLGQVASHNNVSIRLGAQPLLTVPWQELFDAWYQPLNWS